CLMKKTKKKKTLRQAQGKSKKKKVPKKKPIGKKRKIVRKKKIVAYVENL
ncbi:unnamed protein product, partial [marine sediment metagenome]